MLLQNFFTVKHNLIFYSKFYTLVLAMEFAKKYSDGQRPSELMTPTSWQIAYDVGFFFVLKGKYDT